MDHSSFWNRDLLDHTYIGKNMSDELKISDVRCTDASYRWTEVDFLNSTRSMNNRLIVEVYKKEALRSTEKNGFAFVSQKLSLKGLKVLVDVKLNDSTFIREGSIAYIKEETLHTAPWAQKAMDCNAIGQPFLIIDLSHVEFIQPPLEAKS